MLEKKVLENNKAYGHGQGAKKILPKRKLLSSGCHAMSLMRISLVLVDFYTRSQQRFYTQLYEYFTRAVWSWFQHHGLSLMLVSLAQLVSLCVASFNSIIPKSSQNHPQIIPKSSPEYSKMTANHPDISREQFGAIVRRAPLPLKPKPAYRCQVTYVGWLNIAV